MPVYKDNHCNRIAGRVGKTYGYEQKAEVGKKISVAKTPSQAKVIAPKAKRTPMTAKVIKKKVIIKSEKPSVAKKISVVAKTPSQAKVIAPKAKRTPMTATVIPAVIKKKIIKKLAKTPGNSLTGLTPAQMNAMTPAELFGKLPVDIAKLILDPKTTGVKVGAMNIKSIKFDDVIDTKYIDDWIDAQANYWQSMMNSDDFTDVLTAKQSRWYVKNYGENLSEKDEEIKESLERKIDERTGNILAEQRVKIFKKWKTANKGMTGNLDSFEKSFGEFYNSEMN